MTREDIIRMAREIAVQCCNRMPSWQTDYAMGRIMELIDASAAAEREACHALRQTLPNPHEHCQVSAHAYDMAIAAYGAAIRARGQ